MFIITVGSILGLFRLIHPRQLDSLQNFLSAVFGIVVEIGLGND